MLEKTQMQSAQCQCIVRIAGITLTRESGWQRAALLQFKWSILSQNPLRIIWLHTTKMTITEKKIYNNECFIGGTSQFCLLYCNTTTVWGSVELNVTVPSPHSKKLLESNPSVSRRPSVLSLRALPVWVQWVFWLPQSLITPHDRLMGDSKSALAMNVCSWMLCLH